MDYENRSVEWLRARLAAADERWCRAMAHPKYRDEPSDDKPFTPVDELRYFWADAWRRLYHEYEGALFQRREVRHGLLEGLSTREPLTVYEAEE